MAVAEDVVVKDALMKTRLGHINLIKIETDFRINNQIDIEAINVIIDSKEITTKC